MSLVVVLVGIGQIVSIFLASWMIWRYFERKQAQIRQEVEDTLMAWVEPTPDGKSSKFGDYLGVMGACVGSAAAKSLMMQLTQRNTAVTEVANGISGEILAQQNPLASVLAGIGGGRKGKGSAVLQLAQLLGPMLNRGGGSAGPGDNGKNGQGSFSL